MRDISFPVEHPQFAPCGWIGPKNRVKEKLSMKNPALNFLVFGQKIWPFP